MKVLCIDNKPRGYGNTDELVEGETYTVVASFKGIYSGIHYYGLAEFPDFEVGVSGYCADRFIPLSSIDETEMERNYYKQNVKVV